MVGAGHKTLSASRGLADIAGGVGWEEVDSGSKSCWECSEKIIEDGGNLTSANCHRDSSRPTNPIPRGRVEARRNNRERNKGPLRREPCRREKTD